MAKARRNPLLRGLGTSVKRLRESKGWTQETLAAKSGLDRSYVAGIEAGLRNASTKALAKLANALSITLSDIFKGVG
jgi:transcriptional regulator with XRE-family HTH domain